MEEGYGDGSSSWGKGEESQLRARRVRGVLEFHLGRSKIEVLRSFSRVMRLPVCRKCSSGVGDSAIRICQRGRVGLDSGSAMCRRIFRWVSESVYNVWRRRRWLRWRRRFSRTVEGGALAVVKVCSRRRHFRALQKLGLNMYFTYR